MEQQPTSFNLGDKSPLNSIEITLDPAHHFVRLEAFLSPRTRLEMRRRTPTSSRVSPVMYPPHNPEEQETEDEEISDGLSNASERGSTLEEPDGPSKRPKSLAGKTTPKRVYHHTTLAVISLDSTSDDNAIVDEVNPKRSHRIHMPNMASQTSPPSYKTEDNGSVNEDIFSQDKEEEEEDQDYCCFWPFTLLTDKPIVRLFAVMTFNGILSLVCAALIMEIEYPSQVKRIEDRQDMQNAVDSLYKNLTRMINRMGSRTYDPDVAVALLEKYSQAVPNVKSTPEEIKWDMLNAQAFITSVQTTTGYGDIVPITFWGKLFTLVYALVGIPIFMWYIVKLGAVFRLLVMKGIFWLLICLCPSPEDHDEREDRFDRRRSTITRFKILEMKMRLKQQYQDDKRFHPSVIGVILLTFLCCVAIFISHMEMINYFDSFYAAFITYSAIGFGDIDIFKMSYRSNWFNLLIYGNFIHIGGYMILSAWVASILEKCGVRKF